MALTMLSSILRASSLRTRSQAIVSTLPVAADAVRNGLFSSAPIQQHQQQPQQVRWRSNRSRRGLYNGKDIGTGNNVSFSMRATKRTFKPNVFMKKLYSEILDGMIRFHVTASTLRSIDKAGGLDNYLLDPRQNFTEGEGFVVKT